MQKVNELVLCREHYESQEEFENTIKTAVMLLLNAEYVMTIQYDDKGLGIVAIAYEEADRGMGAPYPYWLSPEQVESIEDLTEQND